MSLISISAAFYTAYNSADEAYDRSLFRATLALADQITITKGRVLVDLPESAFQMLEYDKDDWIYYKVTGPNGEFVTGYPDLPEPPISNPQAGQHYYYTTTYTGKKISVAAFYLSLNGTSANGMALVQVGETTSKRNDMAQHILFSMVLPQLSMMILAMAMVWIGVGRGLAGLSLLKKQLANRSHRDLSPLQSSDTPTEVQPMVEAMNDLMARLDQAMDQQRRFVGDASHQLRTPLAGLKTQAEIALRENDPKKVQHTLQHIQTSSSSLAHLVSQLLAMARVEPGANSNLAMTLCNLAEIARITTVVWVPNALNKKIDLGFENHASDALIEGEPTLLKELLNNLIDNAIRYSQIDGHITVELKNKDRNIILCVEDNGPGIPENKRERVFERFYRMAGSGIEGCGLGLSIVREIAIQHNAKIHIENGKEGIGTRVMVTFPLANLT